MRENEVAKESHRILMSFDNSHKSKIDLYDVLTDKFSLLSELTKCWQS